MTGKRRRQARRRRLVHGCAMRRIANGDAAHVEEGRPTVASAPTPHAELKAGPGKFAAFQRIRRESFRIGGDVGTVAEAGDLCRAVSIGPDDDFQIFDDAGHLRFV